MVEREAKAEAAMERTPGSRRKTTEPRWWLGLLFAVWFLPSGSAWWYLMNVVVGFPFGITATLLWYQGRKSTARPVHYVWLGRIVALGWALSAATFLALVLWD